MSERPALEALRLRDDAPASVVVCGPSMQPGLHHGWRLRVVPFGAHDQPAPGDVVVLRAGAGPRAFVTHRVVDVALLGARVSIFHRGDAGGRIGVAPGDAVVGRLAAVLDPPDARLPTLDTLAPTARRAFERARRRVRAYLACRQAAGRLARVGPLAWLARRLLLRA